MCDEVTPESRCVLCFYRPLRALTGCYRSWYRPHLAVVARFVRYLVATAPGTDLMSRDRVVASTNQSSIGN
jgi:hypothetical protein